MSQYPPLPIFDENDEPIGTASLQEILSKGLLHRVAQVIVEEDNGRILLQKRGPNVATNPNTWDFSAAGYVESSESYRTTAERELGEELGLHGCDLEEISIQRADLTLQDRKIPRFVGTYRVVIPAATTLKLETSEVTEAKWFDLDGLKELLENHVGEITPDTADWLWEYYLSDETAYLLSTPANAKRLRESFADINHENHND